MQSILIQKKVLKKMIVTEAFTQASPPQTSILRSWPSNVYAIGIISVILGSFIIMVNDLLRTLPPNSNFSPTKAGPFLLTNARQQQLDKLVNTIPPSPSVITPPSPNKPITYGPATSAPSQVTTTQQAPPTFAPIYLAPPAAPRTTVSAPRP